MQRRTPARARVTAAMVLATTLIGTAPAKASVLSFLLDGVHPNKRGARVFADARLAAGAGVAARPRRRPRCRAR